jgi:hypothetical protein
MKGPGNLFSGMLLGAGVMYLLDPDRGTRRRALLRHKSIHASRKLSEGLGATVRDVRNRSKGAAAEVEARVRRDDASDEVIEERVRSALGRAMSHPSAVATAVHQGRVILSGPVLASEVDGLLDAVRGVRGVTDVENQLEVHQTAEGVPALQGSSGGSRGGSWAPATRVIAGATGGAVAWRGLRSGGFFGNALAALGLGLLTRAATNQSPKG